MFEDSELPDFDSMSQEELIEWLEQLARSHGAAASEFIDEYAGDQESLDRDELDDDDDWSDWLDDTAPGSAAIDSGERFVTDAPGRVRAMPIPLSTLAFLKTKIQRRPHRWIGWMRSSRRKTR